MPQTLTPPQTELTRLLARHDIWQGGDRCPRRKTLSSGHPQLDALLGGGWPAAALTELLPKQIGIGELSLLLPTIQHHTARQHLCIWLNPPYQPYAPALARSGVDLNLIWVVQSRDEQQWLWAAEQSIRSNALLLAWPTPSARPHKLAYSALRKLQLAAADQHLPCFLFNSSQAASTASPATLRMALSPYQQGAQQQLQINLLKLYGQLPGKQLRLPTPAHWRPQTALSRLPVVVYRKPGQTLTNRITLKSNAKWLSA